MKKSKILIPAIAVLALSAGAATTGTLAWFTASRTAAFTLNNVAVVNTSGALTATITHDTTYSSTTAVEDESTKLNFGLLKDASYDASGNGIYQPIFKENVIDSYKKLTNNASVGTIDNGTLSGYVYATAQFSIEFSMNIVSSDSYYLIFDLNSGASSLSGTDTILSAFRLAVLNPTNPENPELVWAPKYNSDISGNDPVGAATGLKYVNNTTVPTDGAYPVYNESIAIAGATTAHYTDATATENTAGSDLQNLGTFTTADSSITLNFVARFEGSDATTIAENAVNTINTLNLDFYAVKAVAGE